MNVWSNFKCFFVDVWFICTNLIFTYLISYI
jgi:hypothetical protein